MLPYLFFCLFVFAFVWAWVLYKLPKQPILPILNGVYLTTDKMQT